MKQNSKPRTMTEDYTFISILLWVEGNPKLAAEEIYASRKKAANETKP